MDLFGLLHRSTLYPAGSLDSNSEGTPRKSLLLEPSGAVVILGDAQLTLIQLGENNRYQYDRILMPETPDGALPFSGLPVLLPIRK